MAERLEKEDGDAEAGEAWCGIGGACGYGCGAKPVGLELLIEDVGELVQVGGFVADQSGCGVGCKFAIPVARRTGIVRGGGLQATRSKLRNYLLHLLIGIRGYNPLRKVLRGEEA